MGKIFESDTFIGCETLTGENNTLVVDVGGGDVVIPLSITGDHWIYKETGANAIEADYPGIYNRVALVASLLTATTFTVGSGTSTRSPFPNSGLVITCTQDFTLRFTHPSFTLNPRVFGMNPDWPDFGDVSSTNGVWRSPYSVGNVWRAPWRATSKLPDTDREIYDSGREDQILWGEEVTREWKAARLPAALIRKTRAGEHVDWADIAALGFGDTNNNLERLWDETLSKKKPALLVHNHGIHGLLELPATGVEVVRLRDLEQRSKKSALLQNLKPQGERYDVSLLLEVLASTYNHS